ncbi:actin-like ATPase domain-containing protein [Apiospora aurea]|uniref:Actin-like ATPase domain-containing protein n=1 Tax=Apiospora aurea TaxID=335848 RepID=A0ABR1Q4K1_9PEZI
MGLPDALGSFSSGLRRGLHQSRKGGTDEEGDDLLLIGIDFGTTSSGVGWATAANIKREQINIITNWPENKRQEGKAPTETFYEHGKTSWGFEVGKDCDPIRWFKILLLKEEDLDPKLRSSEFVLRARQKLWDGGKIAVDLVADYLRCLWAHVLESIAKARGEAVVDALPFHVVITVPAIWKGYARQTMREAAEKAGILNKRMPAGETCLSFVGEPEAAALSTLSEPVRKLIRDEVYLICNCGGGTVDLITYKIRETSLLALEEAVRKVKKPLGRRWDRLSKLDINELMDNHWENGFKQKFSLDHDASYAVKLPSATFSSRSDRNDTRCDPPIKNGRMVFTKDHIKDIFDEAIIEVDKLVDGQIAEAKRRGLQVTVVASPDTLPLFEMNLADNTAKTGDRYSDSNISIFQPGGERPCCFSRMAICRGAVLSGFLQDQVSQPARVAKAAAPVKMVSAIARAGYGVNLTVPYIPVFHRKDERTWDDLEHSYVCKTPMIWLREKGSDVSTTQPISCPLYHILKKDSGGTFAIDIYQCEEYPPPPRKNASVKRLVSISCKIATPLEEVPELFNRLGQRSRKLDFDLDMVPSWASVEFAVWAGGKKLGSSEVQIRYE